jgi:hypothetical protein
MLFIYIRQFLPRLKNYKNKIDKKVQTGNIVQLYSLPYNEAVHYKNGKSGDMGVADNRWEKN